MRVFSKPPPRVSILLHEGKLIFHVVDPYEACERPGEPFARLGNWNVMGNSSDNVGISSEALDAMNKSPSHFNQEADHKLHWAANVFSWLGPPLTMMDPTTTPRLKKFSGFCDHCRSIRNDRTLIKHVLNSIQVSEVMDR